MPIECAGSVWGRAMRVTAAPWCAALSLGVVLGCSAGGSDGKVTRSIEPGSVEDPNSAAVFEDAPVLSGPPESTTGDLLRNPDDVPRSTGFTDARPIRRRGLLEKQVACPGGGTTSVSGTVYIPSGQLPLYNVMVYVPDADLRPFTPGASCNCEITGEPIASALTDASGHFVIENVPVGTDIPLVIQVGDWRREFNIGNVDACADHAVADQTLRLPSRQSEGDIPKIAVATGHADALECLVRKLGVDESEFSGEDGPGRVTLFAGGGTDRYASLNGGAWFPSAESLWKDVEALTRYDVVLMSCDGREDDLENKNARSINAMADYLNLGGRVFGSHFQNMWFKHGPAPFSSLASFESQRDLGSVSGQVVTSFPKGQALSEWLVNAGATQAAGQVAIAGAQHSIVAENPEYTQRWIATDAPEPSVQYVSANTPLGASDAEQCGRLVLSDIHVSPGGLQDDISTRGELFPEGCVTSELTPQEAVLAFMLFDLSGCVVPDDQVPVAPPVILR
jgi:hypothetical protein